MFIYVLLNPIIFYKNSQKNKIHFAKYKKYITHNI
jgi:hypothetical protein